jgi:hypothetical protein
LSEVLIIGSSLEFEIQNSFDSLMAEVQMIISLVCRHQVWVISKPHVYLDELIGYNSYKNRIRVRNPFWCTWFRPRANGFHYQTDNRNINYTISIISLIMKTIFARVTLTQSD